MSRQGEVVSEGKNHAGRYCWTISLDVECPHCWNWFDANSTPDFFENLKGIQVCEAKKGILIECPECKQEFVFDIASGT